jgi:hypothetical protein
MHRICRVLTTLIMGYFFSSYYFSAATTPSLENSKNDQPCLSVKGCPPYNEPQTVNVPGQTTNQKQSEQLSRTAVLNPAPLTANQKFHYYLESTYGPKSFAFSLVSSGISQARNTVPEWEQGAEGYGKRFASNFTQKIVKRTAYLVLVTAFHEDPRYFRSGQFGIVHRSLYAAERVFIAHKDSDGTRFGYTNLIAAFGNSYVSRQWHPDNYHTWGDYMTYFAISLGIDAGKNVFKEFWPDIRRMLHH